MEKLFESHKADIQWVFLSLLEFKCIFQYKYRFAKIVR